MIPRRLFITGTDTGVGKTIVSAILMSGTQAMYWKPVQCGLEPSTDTEWVKRVTGLPASRFGREAYRFREPLSPHAAAAAEGISIDMIQIHPPDVPDLLVEGAGGLMVPLNSSHMIINLIQQLKLPALLVARSSLGTINHTLLSIEALRRSGVELFGVVMNGARNPGNRKAIAQFGEVPVLAEIEPLRQLDVKTLQTTFREQFTGQS